MAESTISIRLEVKSQKVREDLEGAISSTKGFRLQKPEGALSCDVLILEIGNNNHLVKEFELIRSIQTSGSVREVFLTSSRLEPDLLIQALRAGAKEFFPQPIRKEEVENALLKLRERKVVEGLDKGKKKKGKIINIIGSKGGVGTTTIAVNLAINLKESKESLSVALIDMNLIFGEVPVFLNIDSAFNWGEVARNISRLDVTYLMSVLSKHSSGVYVLPSPTGLDGVNAATPAIIEKLLNEMLEVFDFVIVDGGQSFDDSSLKMLEMSDSVLLVGTLSLPCLTNMRRLLWTFKKLGYPSDERIRIIINRYHKKSDVSSKEAEETINKKISWLVPNDYSTTMSAINRGKSLSSAAPDQEISKNLRKMAQSLLGK